MPHIFFLGEDSESDKDNYPSQPDVRQNEHIPNVFDERMMAPVGTRAELRCRVEKHHDSKLKYHAMA